MTKQQQINRMICVIGSCEKPEIIAHVESELGFMEHNLHTLGDDHFDMVVEFLEEIIAEI
jgi:hypothetical protein